MSEPRRAGLLKRFRELSMGRDTTSKKVLGEIYDRLEEETGYGRGHIRGSLSLARQDERRARGAQRPRQEGEKLRSSSLEEWEDIAGSGIWDHVDVDEEGKRIPRTPLEELEEPLSDPFKLLDRLASFQGFVKSSSEIKQEHVSIDINRRRFFLIGWGDLHLDSLHADIPRLRRELELIEALNAGVVFLGDGTDNPVKYQNFDTFLQPKVSRYIFGQIMDRIRKRLLGMIEGCHERHGWEMADVNYIEEYCRTWGIPYIGDRGTLSLHLSSVSYRFGVGHKLRGYSMYNPFHSGIRLLREEFPEANGVMTGHIHQTGIACQVEQGEQKAIMVIGARKMGDRHAERAGFVPTEANKNLPVLELDGERRGYAIYNDIEECAAKNLGRTGGDGV